MRTKLLPELVAEIEDELAEHDSAWTEASFIQERIDAQFTELHRVSDLAHSRAVRLLKGTALLLRQHGRVLEDCCGRQTKIKDELIALRSEPFDGYRILKTVGRLRIVTQEMRAPLLEVLDEVRKLTSWAENSDPEA